MHRISTLALCACLTAQAATAATVSLTVINTVGTSTCFGMKKNGVSVPPANTFLAASGTYSTSGFTCSAGDVITVQTVTHEGNASCAGPYTGGWMEGGAQSYTVPAPPVAMTWMIGGSAPAEPTPHVRLDFWLVNGTFQTQTYSITRSAGGSIGVPVLGPGEHVVVSFPDETATFSVDINNGGAWPAYAIHLDSSNLGGPYGPWQFVDDGPVTPHYTHGASENTTNSPKAQLLFIPEGGPLPGDTNYLTEGTYKAGVENLYSQQRSASENALLALSKIQGALGGAGLSNAAAVMGTASTNLATSGTALGAASTNISVAAGALQSAATNLAGATARMGNPDATDIARAKAVGASAGEVGAIANPYADYSLGVSVGAWGTSTGTVPGPVGGGTWAMTFPFVGVVDFNPLHCDSIAWTAPIFRNVEIWALGIGLIMFCMKRFQAASSSVMSSTQTTGTSVVALGTGGSWATAFIAIGLILLVIAAVPAAWVAFKGSHASVFGLLGVDPMTYFPDLTILLAFFPLDVALVDLAIGMTFWASITALQWTVAVGIRIIPG